MQKIYTDIKASSNHEFYIDNMPGCQFGYFDDAEPGYDWSTHIGEVVNGARVISHADHQWLNKKPE